MNVNDDNRAEALQEIQERFKSGIVHFAYAKGEGEERIAFGTLKQDLIPVTNGEAFSKITTALGLASRTLQGVADAVLSGHGVDAEGIGGILEEIETLYPQNPTAKKKSGRTMPESNQIYYDFEACGFRSFKKENLIKIY